MQFLLPSAALVLDRIVADQGRHILELHVASPRADCPLCKTPSDRVQSGYWRTLADLPSAGSAVQARVRVRRFWCVGVGCRRTIFSERLPSLAPAYARRTSRCTSAVLSIALVLGGEATADLLPRLGMNASSTTLLRMIHRVPLPEQPTPRVLGVDDWALRRGHVYGTILVDLERNAPIELLPDRTAETLADWLRRHPGIEIVTRDRAEAYAQGISLGAPDAVQIADRWHLLKNNHEALERVLNQHRAALAQAVAPAVEIPAVTPVESTPPEAPDNLTRSEPVPAAKETRGPTISLQQAIYDRVRELHGQGLSIHAISKKAGLSRITVRKYLRADRCPHRAARATKIGSLSRAEQHLRRRWQEGCTDATLLWNELRAMGARMSLRTVQRHVAAWRLASAEGTPTPTPARPKAPSPREARWWLVLPAEKLSPEQVAFAARLVESCPEVREAQQLAVEFGRLVRARDAAALELWLQRAEQSEVSAYRAFANGLRGDLAAVRAALQYEWSNGQTEGQVNKLKLLKRQGYGRATLSLLRRRMLLAS